MDQLSQNRNQSGAVYRDPRYADVSQVALIIARQQDVIANGDVFYNLVKQDADKDGNLLKTVKSNDAVVNVLPQKRTYLMETVEELELFRDQLFKRPLVLQPSVILSTKIGSTLVPALSCNLFPISENWVVLVNQMHPKVQGRLSAGLEAAKLKIGRGEPVILQFTLSDVLKRLYRPVLAAQMNPNEPPGRFRYANCEFAELMIRYNGDSQKGLIRNLMQAKAVKFTFEDLVASDIMVRTVFNVEGSMAVAQAMPTDRIRSLLPGWTFDMESDGGPPSYDAVSSQNHAADVHASVGGQPEPNRGRRGRKQAANATLSIPPDAQAPPTYREDYPRPNQRRDDLDGDLYPGSRSSNNSAAADSGYCGPETEGYPDRYRNAHADNRDDASYDNQAYVNGSHDNMHADEKPSQYAARAMQYTDDRNIKPEKPSRKNRSAPMDYAMQDRTDLGIQGDSRYGTDTRNDELNDRRLTSNMHQERYDDDRNKSYDDTRYSHDAQRERYDQDYKYRSQGVRAEQDYTRTRTPERSHRDQKYTESNDVDFQRRNHGYQFGSDEKKDNSISFTSGQYVMKDTGMNESFI